MNNQNDLQRKVAALESKLDHVEAELGYLNEILLECGFPEGVKTLKATIEELLQASDFDQGQIPPEEGSTGTFDLF